MPHSHSCVNRADRLVSQLNQSEWGKIQSTCKICTCGLLLQKLFCRVAEQHVHSVKYAFFILFQLFIQELLISKIID